MIICASLHTHTQTLLMNLKYANIRPLKIFSLLHWKANEQFTEINVLELLMMFCLVLIVSWCIVQITIEKTVLQQNYSYYELQGEYVLPGTRDRNPVDSEEGGLVKRLMSGHIGSVISSMGRWRMKLEVSRAEVAEMLPLARLLSRSMDPAVHSRSQVVSLFMSWDVTLHIFIINHLNAA